MSKRLTPDYLRKVDARVKAALKRAESTLEKPVTDEGADVYDPWADSGWDAADDPSFEGLQ